MKNSMQNCRLCPRECGADRTGGRTGYCGADDQVRVAHTQLHMWEEPCISGKEGSGTVFFSGCNLRCCYCQNAAIVERCCGQPMMPAQLADLFLELAAKGANNINLVTAAHYVPQVAEAIRLAKQKGLLIPVVYNSSGYEKVSALHLLDGLVDIYLPDLKYMEEETAALYSNAPDYPDIAKATIAEMVRQAGDPVFDDRGMLMRGVIVRHLLLPGHVKAAKTVVSYLLGTYGQKIWISLMNQYTPMPAMAKDPLLGRRVTKREYERLTEYALSCGLVNGFIQEGKTADESFIPLFEHSAPVS